MATPYSIENQEFSNQAHEAARHIIYPVLFGCDPSNIKWDTGSMQDGDMRMQTLDGEFGIDRIARVSRQDFIDRLPITIQERFREPKFARWQDITITEWNPRSNTPSELYKMTANLFVYGYYDKQSGRFSDWIAVNIASLYLALMAGTIQYTRKTNPRSSQPFLIFRFDDLHRADAVEARMEQGQQVRLF